MSNNNKIIKEFLCLYIDIFFNHPKNNLLSNMIELKNILRNKIIDINLDIVNKDKISDYFYLSLLKNELCINYIYKIDLIRDLKTKLQKEKINFIRQIIISKIGIELINNYINNNNYYKESEYEELISVEKEFLTIIIKNILFFKEFKFNYTVYDIITKKIDLIYIEIILNLIKYKIFENFEYSINILKQLDLENIKLTKDMFNKFVNELEKNEYLINYQITEPSDFLDKKKVNFYYLLLKYILKDSFLIFQIILLIKARTSIIKIIKNGGLIENNEEISYIIEKLVDSRYYFNLYLLNGLIINKTITNFKTIYNDELTEDKNKKLNLFMIYDNIEKILNKSSFLLKSDEKKYISMIILNNRGDQVIEKRKIEKEKAIKVENTLLKNFEKFLEFLSNIKDKIQKQFKNNYNLLIKLKFNKEDDINNNSNYIYNITCRYYFFPLNEEAISYFTDENILVNGNNEGFIFLINKINDDDYRKINYNKFLDVNNIIKEKENYEKKNKNEETFIKEEKNYEKINKNEETFLEEEKISLLDIVNSEEVSEYKIIKFKKTITTHSNSADFLYKLSNGYYVSGGNQSEIYIFDHNFNKIPVNLRNKPIGICEIKYQDNKNILKLIAYSYENLSLISFEANQKNNNPSVKSYSISAFNLLQIENNNFIINNSKAGYISKDCFYKKGFKKIFKNTYNVGIKINEKLSVFTSNELMPNGKNSLIIYDKILNKIVYELKDYSFSLSQNSLLLIKNNKSLNEDIILVCACKKYSRNQKNGILLVNINFEDKENGVNKFYGTDNFEPYCFSQIFLVKQSYRNKKNSNIIYDTNYLFVGGFNQEKGIGEIYLYKINFENPANDITIDNIQNIILDDENNFEGFNGAITSIIQTEDTGNFLISCSDGNIYLFSPANIKYFLFYDEKEKKEGLNYEEIIYLDKSKQD